MLSVRVCVLFVVVLVAVQARPSKKHSNRHGGPRHPHHGSSEEKKHRWSRPCRVEPAGEVETESCPHNLNCTVGPFNKDYNGTTYNVSVCDPPTKRKQKMASVACLVTDAATGASLDKRDCPENSTCIVGPFNVNINATDVNFFMCDRPPHDGRKGKHNSSEESSVDSPESPESPESLESPESPESLESPESPESPESSESSESSSESQERRQGKRNGRGRRHGRRSS